MPTYPLAGKLVVASRQQLHDKFLQWVLVRNPEEDTREGSQADLDGWVWADAGSLILNQAVVIAGAINRANMRGTQLDDEATRLGTERQGAQGAAGSVALVASSNGAQLQLGDRLLYAPSSTYYEVLTAGLYQNGASVPVGAVDTGPQTDLPAGAILQWVSPRPGVVGGTATVIAQPNGSGLSGGAPEESDDDLRARLDWLAANPPASGNDSEYQQTALGTSGVGIQAVFTYPCVPGPGCTTVVVALRPAAPGGNRIPTSTHIALIKRQLGSVMPATDGIFVAALVPVPTAIVLKVSWAQTAPGWADAQTFPPYVGPGNNWRVTTAGGTESITATSFNIASPTDTTTPQVGQSFALYDQANNVFRRKKILTATLNGLHGGYDVTIDTTNGVSDTTYTPQNGQLICPWSDSLDSLVLPVLQYTDTLGPGEQYASFFDPGLRQKRSPPSPAFWPSQITNRLLGGSVVPQPPQGPQQNQPPVPTLFSTPTLYDVELVEPSVPFSTPVGSPGVSANLLTLANLVAFPE